MSRSRRTAWATPLLAVAVLAGCGGGDAEEPTAAVQVVREDAASDGALRFARGLVQADAGPVTIEMANPSSIPHAIAVRGDGVDKQGPTAGGGETSRVTADLQPGAYTLYCPVGSHEQAGMTARLTVR